MKIIISPAKQMLEESNMLPASALPGYLDQTAEILEYMKSLTYEEAKTLWACNDKIAQENYERFQKMHLTKEEEGYAGSLTHLAMIHAESLEDLKSFQGLGYAYAPDYSDEKTYTFLRS